MDNPARAFQRITFFTFPRDALSSLPERGCSLTLFKRGTVERTIKDEDGRVWVLRPENRRTPAAGRDVVLLATTASLSEPVRLTVGWQWLKMAERGLARLIAAALK